MGVSVIIGLLCLLYSLQSSAQPVVYPLHVGDRWEYRTFWDSVKYQTITTISDTLMPDGFRYAVLKDSRYSLISYERQYGDSVFRYDASSQKGILFFDFSLSPGDTVISIPAGLDTTDIILIDYRTANIFGRNLRQWDFGIDYLRHAIDDEEWYQVTDSIGITYQGGFRFSLSLRGAIINGVQYGTITSIENTATGLPPVYYLHKNYPNPFNPQTTIMYELPERSLVSLKIFNILGDEIATVVNDIEDAGVKEISFNAGYLSSGVYYYRIVASSSRRSFAETRSMVITK